MTICISEFMEKRGERNLVCQVSMSVTQFRSKKNKILCISLLKKAKVKEYKMYN